MRICAAMLVAAMTAQASAQASPQGWGGLAGLKHHKLIVVEASPYGVARQDRCRFESADATTLTCDQPDWHHRRFVFPVAQVDRVYAAERPRFHPSIAGLLVGGGLGFMLGAVITDGNPNLALGIPMGIAMGLVGLCTGVSGLLDSMSFSPTSPRTSKERLVEVYRRPVPAPGP
jgi:hypothetical protein